MIRLEFLMTSLVVVLIPGTGVLYTVSTGITQGARASFLAALGCTAGILPHLAATFLGLAALLHTSAIAFQTLKYAGVVYLFYLAFATWREPSAFILDPTPSPRSSLAIVVKAFLLNILNPKLTIFFLAFLPQFVPASSPSPLLHLTSLSAVFMLMTLLVFIAYGLLAHSFRAAVIESVRVQTWLRRGFAATFAGLGVQLAASRQ